MPASAGAMTDNSKKQFPPQPTHPDAMILSTLLRDQTAPKRLTEEEALTEKQELD